MHYATSTLLAAVTTAFAATAALACGSDDGGGSTSGGSTSGSTSGTTGPSTSETSEGSSSGGSTSDATTGSTSDTADTSSSGGSSGSSSDGTSGTTGGGDSLLVINELSSDNDGVIGADPIEFHNAGDVPVDLSGWIVTDDLATPLDPYDPLLDDEEYVFPDGTSLDPGAYLVVVRGDLPDGHPFGLSADGDAVALLDPSLVVVDFVAYGLAQAAVSYCRLPNGPDGAWQAGCTPTFGDANQ